MTHFASSHFAKLVAFTLLLYECLVLRLREQFGAVSKLILVPFEKRLNHLIFTSNFVHYGISEFSELKRQEKSVRPLLHYGHFHLYHTHTSPVVSFRLHPALSESDISVKKYIAVSSLQSTAVYFKYNAEHSTAQNMIAANRTT